ncbi:PaREP1 family protein [Pyrobaculum sp.]|uniref:PaREP1 family protein n=1 Tax=Pyrobaculum sp. TaxID=2004705 RepID=UPI00316A94D8
MSVKMLPPWRGLEGYIRLRIGEAVAEAELALKFLEQGLHRNATGKAFQAWKALLVAAVAKHKPLVERRFPGVVRDKTRRARSRADMIVALMPTGKLREIAGLLVEVYGWEILYLTSLALDLHDFQYNGLDADGAASRYADLRDVERDIRHLAEKTREWQTN